MRKDESVVNCVHFASVHSERGSAFLLPMRYLYTAVGDSVFLCLDKRHYVYNMFVHLFLHTYIHACMPGRGI